MVSTTRRSRTALEIGDQFARLVLVGLGAECFLPCGPRLAVCRVGEVQRSHVAQSCGGFRNFAFCFVAADEGGVIGKDGPLRGTVEDQVGADGTVVNLRQRA